jgi:hypothetical protein
MVKQVLHIRLKNGEVEHHDFVHVDVWKKNYGRPDVYLMRTHKPGSCADGLGWDDDACLFRPKQDKQPHVVQQPVRVNAKTVAAALKKTKPEQLGLFE